MRLDINLATQPYQDARLFWKRWGVVLAGLSLVTILLLYFTISGWISARQDRAMIHQREEQIAARDQERMQAQALLNAPQNRTIRDRSAFLNDVFERKALSWTQVFEELERVMPGQLHVVSIKPDMTQDNQLELKLVVAGSSRESALDLVRKMEASQRFRQTHVESEKAGQSVGAPQDAIQFDISTLYVPETDTGSQGGSH
ncbi:MAG TPA: PilN domain-containing protein [Terriglobales bacterium]|jgi:type IV pilus assembly protein PilN